MLLSICFINNSLLSFGELFGSLALCRLNYYFFHYSCYCLLLFIGLEVVPSTSMSLEFSVDLSGKRINEHELLSAQISNPIR